MNQIRSPAITVNREYYPRTLPSRLQLSFFKTNEAYSAKIIVQQSCNLYLDPNGTAVVSFSKLSRIFFGAYKLPAF